MRRLLVVPLLLSAGCMSKEPDRRQPPWEPPPQLHAEEPPRPASVVVRELRRLYNDVLRNLLDPYFVGDPELRAAHYTEMRDYIRENYPREKFVETMMELRAKESESTGIPAETDPEADFSPPHYRATMAVAAQLLPHLIRHEKASYVYQFIEKDPLRRELMQMDGNAEYTDFIHWVYGEVSQEEFRKDPASRGYRIERRDRLYGYRSPDQAWEEGRGQRGCLLVRDGRIQGILITGMN